MSTLSPMHQHRLPMLALFILGAVAPFHLHAADTVTQVAPAFSAPVTIERQFQWGAYDSIIAALEPQRASWQDRDTTDSLAARYSVYLGVAYYAFGRIPEARTCFEQAYLLCAGVGLDNRYASPEIVELFQATIASVKREQAQRATQDSLRIAREQTEKLAATQREAMTYEHRRRQRAISAGAGLVSTILFSSLSVYEYQSASRAYTKFKAAANNGDRSSYNHQKSIVDRADGLSVGFAVTAFVCAGAGTYLSLKAVPSLHR